MYQSNIPYSFYGNGTLPSTLESIGQWPRPLAVTYCRYNSRKANDKCYPTGLVHNKYCTCLRIGYLIPNVFNVLRIV